MQRLWRRWHRPLGLLSALPVIVLCVTGVLINHADGLALSRQTVPAWLAALYGHEPVQSAWVSGLGEQQLLHGNDALIMDGQVIAACEAPYLGVLPLGEGWVAGCGQSLVLIWPQAAAVERIDGSWGLPPFDRMGMSARGVVIAGTQGQYLVDADTLQFPSLAADEAITALPEKQALTDQQYAMFADALVPDAFTWQRVLLDVHGFRFLGAAGPWVLDFASLALLVLLLTGLAMWWRGGRRR